MIDFRMLSGNERRELIKADSKTDDEKLALIIEVAHYAVSYRQAILSGTAQWKSRLYDAVDELVAHIETEPRP